MPRDIAPGQNKVSIFGPLFFLRGSLFRGVSVHGVSVLWGLCPVGSLSRGVSVLGISVHRVLCPGGLCPGMGLCLGGFFQGDPSRTETPIRLQVGSMYPTGMLCCLFIYFLKVPYVYQLKEIYCERTYLVNFVFRMYISSLFT